MAHEKRAAHWDKATAGQSNGNNNCVVITTGAAEPGKTRSQPSEARWYPRPTAAWHRRGWDAIFLDGSGWRSL